MSKKTTTNLTKNYVANAKKKRPGIHSKKKSCNSKNAKNYKKKYRGQGK